MEKSGDNCIIFEKGECTLDKLVSEAERFIASDTIQDRYGGASLKYDEKTEGFLGETITRYAIVHSALKNSLAQINFAEGYTNIPKDRVEPYGTTVVISLSNGNFSQTARDAFYIQLENTNFTDLHDSE